MHITAMLWTNSQTPTKLGEMAFANDHRIGNRHASIDTSMELIAAQTTREKQDNRHKQSLVHCTTIDV